MKRGKMELPWWIGPANYRPLNWLDGMWTPTLSASRLANSLPSSGLGDIDGTDMECAAGWRRVVRVGRRGGPESVTDRNASDTARFYRVVTPRQRERTNEELSPLALCGAARPGDKNLTKQLLEVRIACGLDDSVNLS